MDIEQLKKTVTNIDKQMYFLKRELGLLQSKGSAPTQAKGPSNGLFKLAVHCGWIHEDPTTHKFVYSNALNQLQKNYHIDSLVKVTDQKLIDQLTVALQKGPSSVGSQTFDDFQDNLL